MRYIVLFTVLVMFFILAYVMYETANIEYNTRTYSGISTLPREEAIDYIQEYQSEGNFTIPNGDPVDLVYEFETTDTVEGLNFVGYRSRSTGIVFYVASGAFLVAGVLGAFGAHMITRRQNAE